MKKTLKTLRKAIVNLSNSDTVHFKETTDLIKNFKCSLLRLEGSKAKQKTLSSHYKKVTKN